MNAEEFEKNLEIGNKIVDTAISIFYRTRGAIDEFNQKRDKTGVIVGASIDEGDAKKGISTIGTLFDSTNINKVPKERKRIRTHRTDNNVGTKCLDGDFIRIMNNPETESIELADVKKKEKKYFKYGDAIELVEEISNIVGINPKKFARETLLNLFEYKLDAYNKAKDKEETNKK